MMGPLVTVPDMPHGNVTQRAVWWAMFISELLIVQPELREQIPSDAKLIVLPSDDPELCEHNSRLNGQSQGTIVYVRLERADSQIRVTPYIPGNTRHYALA